MSRKVKPHKQHEHEAEARALIDEAFQLYDKATTFAVRIRRECPNYVPQTLANVGFFLRECERLLDETRKELGARRRIIDKHICVDRTNSFMQGGDLNIKTEFCTASPDIKESPKMPKRGSAEFFEITDAMGIPRAAAQVVDLHFVRMQEYLTNLAEEGRNPPFKLTTFPDSKVTYRKKK